MSEKGRVPCHGSTNGGTRGSGRHENGILELLERVETKEDPPKSRPYLQFVNVKIRGSDIQALVDTGATHNFIAESEAKRLGVRDTKGGGSIKR